MSSDAQRTLFHPFENGDLTWPDEGGSVLFLGAEPGFRRPEGFAPSLALVQGFRPHFNSLARAGHSVTPQAPEGPFDGALVLAGRHRGQNEARIAQAAARVSSGGVIVVGGSADSGIASLRKRVGRLVELDGYLPKYHGAAFWFALPADAAPLVAALEPAPRLADGRFVAAPGMFSPDRVDAGSRLLAEYLPAAAKGAAADFGAGWGYLSVALAERTSGLKSIDLYEADYGSLEAAKHNLASLPAAPAAAFFWQDLVGEPVEKRYDLIVMNPPFHQGRAADPGIGQAMIAGAAAALKPGGRIFMVQNRGLPYDQILRARFSRVEEVARDAAFRVVVAQR